MEMNIVFAVELLTLVLGTMLYVKSFKPELTCCRKGVRIISYFVIIASFLLMISSGIGCYKHCKRNGWYNGPMRMNQMNMNQMDMRPRMMDPKMRERMMKECPMMRQMMEDMQRPEEGPIPMGPKRK